MKRTLSAPANWRRYVRPPPPTPRDARWFTWSMPVLGVLMLIVAWFLHRAQGHPRNLAIRLRTAPESGFVTNTQPR